MLLRLSSVFFFKTKSCVLKSPSACPLSVKCWGQQTAARHISPVFVFLQRIASSVKNGYGDASGGMKHLSEDNFSLRQGESLHQYFNGPACPQRVNVHKCVCSRRLYNGPSVSTSMEEFLQKIGEQILVREKDSTQRLESRQGVLVHYKKKCLS